MESGGRAANFTPEISGKPMDRSRTCSRTGPLPRTISFNSIPSAGKLAYTRFHLPLRLNRASDELRRPVIGTRGVAGPYGLAGVRVQRIQKSARLGMLRAVVRHRCSGNESGKRNGKGGQRKNFTHRIEERRQRHEEQS